MEFSDSELKFSDSELKFSDSELSLATANLDLANIETNGRPYIPWCFSEASSLPFIDSIFFCSSLKSVFTDSGYRFTEL